MERRGYYAAGAQRASKVHELFSVVAGRYDFINDVQSFLLHRLWKRRLLRLAAPATGTHALDVCCGTGDVTRGLAASGAAAVGLDFCRPMLAVALRRPHETARVKFVQGDAQALPFADHSFDLVTISYGLRNLADWKLGLAEMGRVLKPGGRLLILDFARPKQPLWRTVYLGYLRSALPGFGWLLCGDAQAYAYILDSLNHYPEPELISDALHKLGFGQTRVLPLLGGIMTIHVSHRNSHGQIDPTG